MSKKPNAPIPLESPADAGARLVVTDEDKGKARKWFVRARELGDKRQFDYAIEYYIHGLEFWPDAVEEACKPLHGCAVARRQMGGKKPGLKDTMTRSTTDKDPRKAFLNAFWLFGHEPDNIAYIEAVAKNAARLRADSAALWAGGVWMKAVDSAAKTAGKQYHALALVMDEVGERASARNDGPFGVEAYTIGVEAVRAWLRKFAKDETAEGMLKQLSTKLTILRGKYQENESYRESIKDVESQRAIHDVERTVQADTRMEELIQRAEAEYRANPDAAGKLRSLVDLLCRREDAEDETKAIGLLVADFKRTGDYRWKQLADDIRIRQLARDVREAEKTGDAEAVKNAKVALLRFEFNVYKERTTKFPTDNRIRFEYAVRNFQAGRVDDAIPLFQTARNDPKNRAACGLYLGRCFYKKNYHSQAVSTLQEAIADYEFADDDTGKSLRYWLGRSQEAGGDRNGAAKTYGDLLQVDYNYLDVRARLNALMGEG